MDEVDRFACEVVEIHDRHLELAALVERPEAPNDLGGTMILVDDVAQDLAQLLDVDRIAP